MINKLVLQSIINKYHLGIVQSVNWSIKNNTVLIDFMDPSKEVIGNVEHTGFELENCDLSIFDTKKLQNLVSITNGDLIVELEKNHLIPTKLKISDPNFNLTYRLGDPLLIDKVGTVNIPNWENKIPLEVEDLENLIKAKNALREEDNMFIETTTNDDGDNVCKFVFGDVKEFDSKITYQLPGEITELGMKMPFNSELFKSILYANKDMDTGEIHLTSTGLMKINFTSENTTSEYFIVRKVEDEF